MDYRKEYDETKEWHRKVCLIHLYHSHQLLHDKRWTLINTAVYFGVSIGLVSENIKLAKAIDTRPELMKCDSRQKALNVLEKKNGARINFDEDD
jgi:hypothetical protein